MKKRRILSVLTSIAMAATVVSSTLASTVSAATVVDKDSTMVLRFAPEKTSFTMDEVKAGNARTTVALMCDQYDAAEEVTQILTSFKGSADGIKFQNINVTDPNAFTVDGGFGMLAMDIEVVGFDPADNTKIADQTGFFIQNGATPFILGDKNNSIVTFDVIFDSSMAAGTYTVDFMDNFSVNSGTVSGDGTIITTYGNSVNKNSEPATFTLGSGEPSTEPSTEPTTEPPKTTTTIATTTTRSATTPAPTPNTTIADQESSDTTAPREYVGTCDIWADKDVKGAVGDQVTVNFYADTQGNDIRGFEARPIFDTSALKIVGYKYSTGFMAKPTANEDLGTYVIASAAAKIKNDPTTPYLTLTFEILEGASGTYPIDIQGCNGAAKPVINFSNGGEGTTYLTPNVTPGSIVVSGGDVETTEGQESSDTTAPREYVGTCDIWADKDVKGAVGDQVTVNFYADTHGDDIRGFEARPIFDTDALKIVGYKYSTGFMAKPTANESLGTYVIASAAAKIKNDPTTPYLTLTFEILDGATPGETYEIDIQGCNGAANPVINFSNGGEGTTYLTPNVTPGSIVVTGEDTTGNTGETDPSDDPTDPTDEELVVEFDYDVDKDDVQWYHSDNVEFRTDGIVVMAGDEDVTDKAVITFASTPSKVYDGENFDYSVAFTVLYNGQEVEGDLSVKIAPRGDANLSAGKSADIYDAVQVAKFILPKPTATIAAGFNTFAADNNEDGVVNIYDAINVATLILPANNGNWDKVDSDHQQWIKD